MFALPYLAANGTHSLGAGHCATDATIQFFHSTIAQIKAAFQLAPYQAHTIYGVRRLHQGARG